MGTVAGPGTPGQVWLGTWFNRSGVYHLPLVAFGGLRPEETDFINAYPQFTWELHREDEHLMILPMMTDNAPYIGVPPGEQK